MYSEVTMLKQINREDDCKWIVHLLSVVALVCLFVGCGIDEGRKYQEKSFVSEGQSPVTKSADATAIQPAPSAVPTPVDRNVSSDVEEETIEIDPNEVVLNNQYRAKFALTSMLRLVDGKAPDDSLGLARSTIEDRLNGTTEKDGLLVSQNYGDGTSRSTGTQLIVNTPGDAELAEGASSSSGIKTYDRVVDGTSCPSELVCIDRLTFDPTIGDSVTYCYFDPATGKGLAIPYAIPPTTKQTELSPLAKIYGPYQARRFRVSGMDCNQPTAEPDLIENFTVELKSATKFVAALNPFFQRAGALNYDFEAVMINRRVDNDAKAPYIDETMKLQMQTRYVFDNEKSLLVKMIKTVRSSVKLPFPVNLIMSMNGLQVDLHFELCQNLMNAESGSYCD